MNSDKDVFSGAVVSNQADFIKEFNYIFFLSVDENTLRNRLSQHEHESHHLQGEIDRIAKDHIEKQQRIIDRMSAIVIDASVTVDYIVDEILKRTKISLD